MDVLHIFDRKRKIGKNAQSETDNFSVNFSHVHSQFYLWKRIHDPVSVTWIALINGKLVGFKKQFVC